MITTSFEYKDKSWGQSLYDALLIPISYALGGRHVTVYDAVTGELMEAGSFAINHKVLEFQISREKRGLLNTVSRVTAGIVAIGILPLTILGFFGKLWSQDQDLIKSYTSRQAQITLEDRSENHLWSRLARYFFTYSDIHAFAHIQADLQMSETSTLSPPDKQLLEKHQGGSFYGAATLLRQKLEKYQDLPGWGTEIRKALKIMREYEKWSTRIDLLAVSYVFPSLQKILGKYHEIIEKKLTLDLQDHLIALKSGEAFLLPIMLLSSSHHGHAISALIKKKENGIFSIRIYDSDMLQYKETRGKRMVETLELNISQEKMTNFNVLNQLITYTASFTEIDKFYEFIQSWGKSNSTQDQEAHASLTIRTKQRAATCTLRTLLFALKDNMSPSVYKGFIFATKRDDIQDLYEKYLKHLHPNQPKSKLTQAQKEVQVLLKIGIEEFNKRIQKKTERHADAEEDHRYQRIFNDILKQVS